MKMFFYSSISSAVPLALYIHPCCPNMCQYIYMIVIMLFFQIPIATSGIRGMGFLMRHQLRTEGLSVSQRMITQLVKVKQEPFDSIDI